MTVQSNFKVSDKARIAWILQSVQRSHQLLRLSFAGGQLEAQSIVVQVDADKGYFYIDEPPCTRCCELAIAGEPFDLATSLSGVDVTATGLSIVKVVEDPQGAMYKVALPAGLGYVQRRDSYRASLVGLSNIVVDVSHVADGESAESDCEVLPEAALEDISSAGCCISMRGDKNLCIGQEGEQLLLSMYFPDTNSPVSIVADVRHTRFVQRLKLWLIGCQFTAPDMPSQKLIDSQVFEAQRLQRLRESSLN
jgi:c-di-GMP-binding flagellar brake protein YcgR